MRQSVPTSLPMLSGTVKWSKVEKTVCQQCFGAGTEIVRPLGELKPVCNQCQGTKREAIPWSELFKPASWTHARTWNDSPFRRIKK